MKSNLASAVALIVTLGLAGTVFAQARHDEKPHGYDKSKATTAAKAEMPAATGGRHDEKPHGTTKPKTSASKSTDAKATASPGDARVPAKVD
jgi:hypothetical protein